MAAKTLDESLNYYIERYDVEWKEVEELFGVFTDLNARGAYVELIEMKSEAEEFKEFLHDWFSNRDEEE